MDELERRRATFWEFFDFGTGRGLEVGPLDRAIVPPESDAEVAYLDVWDQAGVRAHYAGDPGVDPERIPVMDYHLIQADGRALSLAEAARAGAPFDWVMASHVIEHVPDVIGWLDDLAELTVDGGALVLAVPDKRYCFDVSRPVTTVGQMLAARERGDSVPSIRAVYDHFSSALDFDASALWRGEPPDLSGHRHSFEQASELADRSLTGEYIDAHVWLFTPDLLTRQMRELRRIGRSQWYVEKVRPTPRNGFEFLVTMRRVARDADGTARADEPADEPADELAPAGEVPDWLEAQSLGLRARELERRLAKAEERLAARGARVKQLRRRLAAARRELDAIRGSRTHRLAGKVASGATKVTRRLPFDR